MSRNKKKCGDNKLKVTINIRYITNPSPGQLTTWRSLWNRLLKGVIEDSRSSAAWERENGKDK